MFLRNKLSRIIGIVVLGLIGNISIGHAQSSSSPQKTSKNQIYQPIDVSKAKMEKGEVTAQKKPTPTSSQKYQPIDVSKLKAEMGEPAGKSSSPSKPYQPMDISKSKAKEAARLKQQQAKEE